MSRVNPRFGSYPLNEAPVHRTVNISNQGPVDIRLDWETYNIVPRDNTLVDVNFYIGDAFPDKTAGMFNRIHRNTSLSSSIVLAVFGKRL